MDGIDGVFGVNLRVEGGKPLETLKVRWGRGGDKTINGFI